MLPIYFSHLRLVVILHNLLVLQWAYSCLGAFLPAADSAVHNYITLIFVCKSATHLFLTESRLIEHITTKERHFRHLISFSLGVFMIVTCLVMWWNTRGYDAYSTEFGDIYSRLGFARWCIMATVLWATWLFLNLVKWNLRWQTTFSLKEWRLPPKRKPVVCLFNRSQGILANA